MRNGECGIRNRHFAFRTPHSAFGSGGALRPVPWRSPGQEATAFELRAATSLARLWQRQGKREDPSETLAKEGAARALLALLYAAFL